ncbi:MAG: hypothetical protein WKF89_07630, partial [Chitinophagaceae bacterium]
NGRKYAVVFHSVACLLLKGIQVRHIFGGNIIRPQTIKEHNKCSDIIRFSLAIPLTGLCRRGNGKTNEYCY